jgi:hypothetical protein
MNNDLTADTITKPITPTHNPDQRTEKYRQIPSH